MAWSCCGKPEVVWIQLWTESRALDESTWVPADDVTFKLSMNWDFDGICNQIVKMLG